MSEEDDEEEMEALASIDAQLRKVDKRMLQLEAERNALVDRRREITERQKLRESQRLQDQDWEDGTFSWSPALKSKLSSAFGLNDFRPLQRSAMNALLSGMDVFLVMPTGGGKSLCFQLPALLAKGITLVVSPLVALMEDQVMALKRKGIGAEMMNADTTRADVNRIFEAMVDAKSDLKLLYVTPEKLSKSKRFMTKLQSCHKLGLFSFLAVDEVHCCSQWGHDFRPDYKFLGVMRSLFPKVPIMGLTATSTATVTEDCQKMLALKSCLVFRAPFNRPNLYYEVRVKPDSHEDCVNEIGEMLSNEFKDQSGIIYTLSIKDVEMLAKDLREKGLKVAPYHANLEGKSRSNIHQKWLSGKYQAVVATIAFGMGIDKPDVRFVLHHSISKSMENFYQESGRAGRDDQPAKCIAFYKFGDVFRLSTMVFTEQTGLEKLYGMVAYCINYKRCRRSIIADHFGETWDSSECNQMCDVCVKTEPWREMDISEHAEVIRKALQNAAHADVKLTGLKLLNILLGKGEVKLRVPVWKPGNLNKLAAERIITFLLLEGFLKEDFAFTPYSTLSYIVGGTLFTKLRNHVVTLPAILPPSPAAVKRKSGAVGGRVAAKSSRQDLMETLCVNLE